MKTTRLAVLIVAGAVALTSGPILADQDVRHVPDRDIPVPATVSPATQAVIARPLSPTWNEHPKSAEEWKVLIARVADNVVATLPDLRQRLGVKVEPTVIGGVKAYVITPESITETNRNRLLVHVHGGGYVFGPGEAGTREAMLMAGYSGMKVISVDYRSKMRAAGVETELQVFEGQSHAQADPSAPETKEYFAEVTQFLDKHLAK